MDRNGCSIGTHILSYKPLLPALVIAPLRSLSPLECSEGVRPTHAANERAFDWIEKRPSAVVPAGAAVRYVALWA